MSVIFLLLMAELRERRTRDEENVFSDKIAHCDVLYMSQDMYNTL